MEVVVAPQKLFPWNMLCDRIGCSSSGTVHGCYTQFVQQQPLFRLWCVEWYDVCIGIRYLVVQFFFCVI